MTLLDAHTLEKWDKYSWNEMTMVKMMITMKMMKMVMSSWPKLGDYRVPADQRRRRLLTSGAAAHGHCLQLCRTLYK